MTIDNDKRFMKLLQNRLPVASISFFEILLKKFLRDPTFSSSLNVSPRSTIHFTTETKRCRSDFKYCWHWL